MGRRRRKMTTYRSTAITVGALFIVATVANVVGNLSFSGPILDTQDYLTSASANGNQLIVGALLELTGAFAVAGIAIWLYPLLRKYNEGLALGAVGFRLIESVLYVLAAVVMLSILTLSQEYVRAGAADTSLFRASGASLLALRDWAGQLSVIAFAPGALMYYSVLFQSRLIPRWLSGWGIAGASLSFAAALLSMFGLIVPMAALFLILNLPIGVQEMVLAVWLIIKGFNPSAVASLSSPA
jgi:hypothetical protein